MNTTSRPPGRPAVVLLSGGLDSTTTLAIAIDQGYTPHALSFDYGQRHRTELMAARAVAQLARLPRHVISTINLREFGGSALTDHIPVPKRDSPEQIDPSEIPVTYVPARNTVFLSFALAYAETIGAVDIFTGVNAVDYSGYPDCRPEYIAAFEHMANLATRAGVEGHRVTIHTPLIHMTKADIVRTGLDLGVDYSLTSSCYDPGFDGACGSCDSCLLRLEAFAAAGVEDPIRYRYRVPA